MSQGSIHADGDAASKQPTLRPRLRDASEDSATDLVRHLARTLPLLLDAAALEALAERLQPYLTAQGSAAPTENDGLLTCHDAAEMICVNVETVRRAIRSGQLPVATRIGRSPRITRDALHRWLAEMAPRPAPARRPVARRRPTRQDVHPEHSLQAAFES